MKQLFDLGLHFGHLKSNLHPRSKNFIFTITNGICIIDLEKTKASLKKAIDFVKDLSKEKKIILFVGTKKQVGEIIQREAEKINMPYVQKRFMGGTLTNFETMQKNIKKFHEIEEKITQKEKFTKKQLIKLTKEKERLDSLLGGISKMEKLPDALFIVDVAREKNALLESNRLGIPVIAILDTNGNASRVDFPIYGNDDSVRGVEFILQTITQAYSKPKTEKK